MNDSPTPRRFPVSRATAIWTLVLLVSVAVAFVAGLATAAHVITDRAHHYIHHPEAVPEPLTDLLRHRLDLSDEQGQQMQAVFDERVAYYRNIQKYLISTTNFMLDGIDEDIQPILDESQREEWDAMFGAMREQWIPISE